MTKYAVDSLGVIHDIDDDKDIFSVIKPIDRLKALWFTSEKIIPILQQNGVSVKKEDQIKIFDYFFQPFASHEYIVFYVKTPIASTSNEVKLAYLLKQDKEKAAQMRTNVQNGLKTQFSDNMLLSIVQDKNQKNKWWFISTAVMKIERNEFDGKMIHVELKKLVSFVDFVETMKPILEKNSGKTVKTEENKHKFFLFSPSKRTFGDIKAVAEVSLIIEKKNYEIGKKIDDTFGPLHLRYDRYSNKRANYINSIVCNPLKGIFPVYDDLKKFLFKNFKQVRSVQYKGSRITFILGTHGRQTVYVYTDNKDFNKISFIMNGHRYKNIDELKAALLNSEKSKCFETMPEFIINNKDVVTYYFN